MVNIFKIESYIKFRCERMSPASGKPQGLDASIAAAETALKSTAIGLLSSLNARSYARFGRPFLEVLVTDPVAAYREAIAVAPQGHVEAAIKIALRAVGLEPKEVVESLDALRRGDRSQLLRAVRGGR